jgi:KDO2-lipid IV(A) lauroyltransferase
MYYFFYGLLYFLSLFPLRILYVLSDFIYVIIYHVAGYRKKVVMRNLSIAFPEKTIRERKDIAKKFYRNFADFFVETIKLFTAGDDFIKAHFVADYSIFNQLHAQGKKCQVHLGHNFNWEIAYHSIASSIVQNPLGVYMPLSNKSFDRIFRKLRSKRGGHLVPATGMREGLFPFRNTPYVLLLVADQSPPSPQRSLWVHFFGRPTPFVAGPENGARAGNLPVIFSYFEKKKRGYYEGHFVLATEDPASLPKGELTRMYARFLEDKMQQQPPIWLWSHRRWKWEYRAEFGEVYQ